MATVPGTPVVMAHYGESMVLYSAGLRVEAEVSGAPPVLDDPKGDPDKHTGRTFVIPVGKATKVPYEAGRFILDHLGYTGVVRVDVKESESGTKYDIEKAKRESEEKLKRGDEIMFKSWLTGVIDDFVKRNKPVPAPEGNVLAIIERRGYDLRKYGITPIGWGEKAADDEKAELKKQIADLQAQVALLAKAGKP
jgi:hypothetical protein